MPSETPIVWTAEQSDMVTELVLKRTPLSKVAEAVGVDEARVKNLISHLRNSGVLAAPSTVKCPRCKVRCRSDRRYTWCAECAWEPGDGR